MATEITIEGNDQSIAAYLTGKSQLSYKTVVDVNGEILEPGKKLKLGETKTVKNSAPFKIEPPVTKPRLEIELANEDEMIRLARKPSLVEHLKALRTNFHRPRLNFRSSIFSMKEEDKALGLGHSAVGGAFDAVDPDHQTAKIESQVHAPITVKGFALFLRNRVRDLGSSTFRLLPSLPTPKLLQGVRVRSQNLQ